MIKEQIFRKMKTWNTVFIIFSIIGAVFSVFSLGSAIAINPEYLKYNMLNVVIAVVILVVSIYTIIVAIQNNKKIAEEKEINTIPYILRLIIQAYSIITTVITFFNGSLETTLEATGMGLPAEEMQMVITIGIITGVVTLLISTVIGVLPSTRVLMLKGKDKKLEEVSELNDEEE